MTNFISKRGLFGYKVIASNNLEDYTRPNKKMTGTVYEIKPTASGISVLRNGSVVCEGLESIKHEENDNFFIGYKKGQQICFDAVNGKEIDVFYCSSYQPNYVIAKDGSVFGIKDRQISAEARDKKAFFNDSGEIVHSGMSTYLTQNEDGSINLTGPKGETILDSFTTDKYVKCSMYNKRGRRGLIEEYVQVSADGKQVLFDTQTKKLIYETELDRKIEVFSGYNKKMSVIADYDEKNNTSHIEFLTGEGRTRFSTEGKVYSLTDENIPAVIVANDKDSKKKTVKHFDKDGKDVSAKNTMYFDKKEIEIELREAEAEVKRLEAIAEEADSSNRRTAVTNTLMGASLMGLGRVTTGATVMATSAIMRHNREQEVEEARKKAAEARKKLESLEAKNSQDGPSK